MPRLRRGFDRLRSLDYDVPSPTYIAEATFPDYEPPSCPLNEAARTALGELANDRRTLVYDSQLKDSIRNLGLSVGDLHERLLLRHDRLQHLRRRRQDKGTGKTAEEDRLEKHLDGFEQQVDQLTRESELSLRELIDYRAELQDQTQVLSELYTNAATVSNTPRRTQDDADENPGQEDEPVFSTRDAFRSARAAKQAQYVALSLYERYALNNDYAGFKKIWHDAAAGEDGPPLPDASRWFRSDGHPNVARFGATSRRSMAGAAADADDDDIAVAREILSLNCPLTLRQMEEPYSNNKCKHTFEKSALLDYLSATESSQCPQTGCSQMFSRAMFDTDFYLDQAMLRRIQRANQNPRGINNMDDEDEDEDEDGCEDETLVICEERPTRGRTAKIERL